MYNFDLLPPQNVEAEQSILGAVFLRPAVIESLIELLEPKEFYLPKHQKLFKAMVKLHEAGNTTDLGSVSAYLQDRKLLEEVGGVTYLTDLASSVPTAANIDYYAKIVREKADARLLIDRATKVIQQAYQGESTDELMDKAEQILSDIKSNRTGINDFKPIREVTLGAYERIEMLSAHKGEIIGIPSGYPDLDKMTAGFQRSDLIILAARPSVGKTAFALNVAQNVATKTNEPVAIFSLEMSGEQLVTRMICAEGNINAQRLRTGHLDEDDWQKLTHSIGIISKAPIFIDDTPGITVQEIRRKARSLKKEQGLGLILIDYLQLIQGTAKGNRQEQVSDISRMLKGIAKELDVPVIALSQLSRSVEQRQDKRPMMSDIRESGSIEQDADIVAFLYRDDYYDKESEAKNVVEVIIAKQRNGPTGTVELAFLKEFNKFVSLDHRYGRQLGMDDVANG